MAATRDPFREIVEAQKNPLREPVAAPRDPLTETMAASRDPLREIMAVTKDPLRETVARDPVRAESTDQGTNEVNQVLLEEAHQRIKTQMM